jgi:hypothetical protein
MGQIIRYILIIPGFGIISTTISASSNKSIFGYLGIDKKKPWASFITSPTVPNSGEPLKLKVPSCNRKITSGWTNYSGMVTSLKISENLMGYRGSKSDLN